MQKSYRAEPQGSGPKIHHLRAPADEGTRKTYYGHPTFGAAGGLNLLRLPLVTIIVGAILAAAGAVLFLAYPSLIISAVNVEEFQDQWRPGNNDTFKDHDSGDTVYIKDEIAGVHYDDSAKLTVIRIVGKGSLGDLEFNFKGKVYDNFAKDDMVLIRDKVTLKNDRETLQGLDSSLAEDDIQHLYGSSTEMGLGLLAVVGIVVMVVGLVMHLKGFGEKKGEDIEPYEMAPQSGVLPGAGPAMQPGMQPGYQPGMQPGHQQAMQPGMQPGMYPGMAPAAAPAAPVTVACPTCQQHLMIGDPTRPLTVACPHCANPLMVQ